MRRKVQTSNRCKFHDPPPNQPLSLLTAEFSQPILPFPPPQNLQPLALRFDQDIVHVQLRESLPLSAPANTSTRSRSLVPSSTSKIRPARTRLVSARAMGPRPVNPYHLTPPPAQNAPELPGLLGHPPVLLPLAFRIKTPRFHPRRSLLAFSLARLFLTLIPVSPWTARTSRYSTPRPPPRLISIFPTLSRTP